MTKPPREDPSPYNKHTMDDGSLQWSRQDEEGFGPFRKLALKYGFAEPSALALMHETVANVTDMLSSKLCDALPQTPTDDLTLVMRSARSLVRAIGRLNSEWQLILVAGSHSPAATSNAMSVGDSQQPRIGSNHGPIGIMRGSAEELVLLMARLNTVTERAANLNVVFGPKMRDTLTATEVIVRGIEMLEALWGNVIRRL